MGIHIENGGRWGRGRNLTELRRRHGCRRTGGRKARHGCRRGVGRPRSGPETDRTEAGRARSVVSGGALPRRRINPLCCTLKASFRLSPFVQHNEDLSARRKQCDHVTKVPSVEGRATSHRLHRWRWERSVRLPYAPERYLTILRWAIEPNAIYRR